MAVPQLDQAHGQEQEQEHKPDKDEGEGRSQGRGPSQEQAPARSRGRAQSQSKGQAPDRRGAQDRDQARTQSQEQDPDRSTAAGPGLAHGWCALSALHGRIESHIERELQAGHGISVREFSVLDVLSSQQGGEAGHLRMNQLSDAVVLSQSATTRLVNRLEDRGLLSRYLCATDRRGIYTEVSPAGRTLLEQARPTHDRALREALRDAAQRTELAPLVAAVESLSSTGEGHA